MPEPIVYAHDRPDVEVLYEGVWCPGEVRMVRWVDGAELHQVQERLSTFLRVDGRSSLRCYTGAT